MCVAFFLPAGDVFAQKEELARIVGLNRNHAAAFRHRGELPALILKLLLVHPVENFEAGLSLCVPRVFRSDRDFRISRIHWRHIHRFEGRMGTGLFREIS